MNVDRNFDACIIIYFQSLIVTYVESFQISSVTNHEWPQTHSLTYLSSP